MIPRCYQERAIAEARTAIVGGARRVLIVSPTGTGKTATGSLLAARHLARSPANRVLWLAHRQELVQQAAGALRGFGLDVGALGANAAARTQVCMLQTLLARGEVPESTLVVADEAHHFASDGDWIRVLNAAADDGSIVVGLTATPERGDGKALDFFKALVVTGQVKWFQEHTCSTCPTPALVPCDLVRVGRPLGPGTIAEEPVDFYQRVTPGTRAVVFAPHITAACDYAAGFQRAGISAGIVVGAMGDEKRTELLSRFAAGDIRVLCNVYVLTEGWDCPPLETVVIGRGVDSAGMYLQITGRGGRPSPGKTHYTLADLRGVSWIHGAPDEERVYSLEGRGISRRAGPNARLCKTCKIPIPDGLVRCPFCQREAEPLKTPRALGEECARYEGLKQSHEWKGAPRHVQALAGMIRKARANGYKSGWIRGVFMRMYKRPARASEFDAAEELLAMTPISEEGAES